MAEMLLLSFIAAEAAARGQLHRASPIRHIGTHLLWMRACLGGGKKKKEKNPIADHRLRRMLLLRPPSAPLGRAESRAELRAATMVAAAVSFVG